ncbi:hypothetical protein P3X46_023528 [Hevea brasiliensis]|uniref:At1g61320/AtMIF1 LRR domain-containing protein n=1 Tax=Hevea brasiliensis TaxID=3981 RepID=A0ABQ9LD58_HEVBR|nr:hypothetical protein P3X46_023528 [Hevea brasiliensis]
MSRFSGYLSRLEKFELDLMSLKILGSYPRFPKLTNVKHLELAIYAYDAYNLICCTSFLMVSPLLQRLKLKILGLECLSLQCKKKKQKAKPHRCLKVVELGGFVGYAIDVELAKNILKRAVSLEKLVIDPCAYSWGEREERTDLECVIAARACAKQLDMSLPPGAELVILSL